MAEPRIGDLKYVVDFERRQITEGGTGDPVVTWIPVAKNVYAAIRPVSVRELLAGLVVASEVSTIITIRWRNDIDATMRIKRRISRRTTPRAVELYNIAGPLHNYGGRRRWIEIRATLGVNEGDSMYPTMRVEEKGLRELGEAMRKLFQQMNLRIAAQLTGAAGKIIKEEAKKRIKANPSYQTGSLYDAVIVKKIPRSQTDLTSEHIVTVRGRGTKKQRAREAAKGRKVSRVTYGHILEWGTVHMPAEPFLRPGFETGKTRAKDALIAKLRTGIEKASK